MGQGIEEPNDTNSRMGVLPQQIAGVYAEFAESHAREARAGIYAAVNGNIALTYNEVVGEVGLRGTGSEHWDFCCNTFIEFTKSDPDGAKRFHTRMNALQGLALAENLLTVLRKVEGPRRPNPYLEAFKQTPFESRVFNDKAAVAFSHWERGTMTRAEHQLALLIPRPEGKEFDPNNSLHRSLYFGGMRDFMVGLADLTNRMTPVLEAFSVSTKSSFATARGSQDREMLFMSSGYIDKAARVISVQSKAFFEFAALRVTRVGLAMEGIHYDRLRPAAKRYVIEALPDIANEFMRMPVDEIDVPTAIKAVAEQAATINASQSGLSLNLPSLA